MTRKIVKRSTFFAPDHLKVWPTVGPGSTGNLDWIILSWNYDFKKTIIFNLWLLNHCPLWEPKFSDPDARRQTFVSFFSGFQVHAGRKRDFLYRTTLEMDWRSAVAWLRSKNAVRSVLTGIHLQKESCPQQAAFWGRSPIRVLTDLDLA